MIQRPNPTSPPTRSQQQQQLGYPAQPKPNVSTFAQPDPTANPMSHGGALKPWQTMYSGGGNQVYNVNSQPSYRGPEQQQQQQATQLYQQNRDVPGFTNTLGDLLDMMRGNVGMGELRLAGGKLYEVLANGAWRYIGPFQMPGALDTTGYAPSAVPMGSGQGSSFGWTPPPAYQPQTGFTGSIAGSSVGAVPNQTPAQPALPATPTLLDVLGAAYRQSPSESLAYQIKMAQSQARQQPVAVSGASPFDAYNTPNPAWAGPRYTPPASSGTSNAYERPPVQQAPAVSNPTPNLRPYILGSDPRIGSGYGMRML